MTVTSCPQAPGLIFSFGPHQELLYISLGINIAALIIGLIAPRRYPTVTYWLAFIVGSAICIGGYLVAFDVIPPSLIALTNWSEKSVFISGCYTSATKAQFNQQSALLERLRMASIPIGIMGYGVAIAPTIVSLLWLTPYARRLAGSNQTVAS